MTPRSRRRASTSPDGPGNDLGSVEDVPWPSAADSLKEAGSDWASTVELGWAQGQEGLRADAFRAAASVLAETIASRGLNRPEFDLLAYPLLFCWRHSLELQLKEVIGLALQVLDESGGEGEPHHRLGDLWAQCRELLSRVDERNGRGNAKDYDNAGRIILQLDRLDPSGEHFRYAWAKTTKRMRPAATLPGVGSLAIDRMHVALMNASQFLHASSSYLNGLVTAGPGPSEW